MSRKSLPILCISVVFAFAAIKRRETNYLLWVSSIREVKIFISVFHSSRSLAYNLSEIPLHRNLREKKYRTECLDYDFEIWKTGFASRGLFLESPETFRVTILFVSSKRRCSMSRNFAVILIFIAFTTYGKTTFIEWAGHSFTNCLSGSKSFGSFEKRTPDLTCPRFWLSPILLKHFLNQRKIKQLN